MQVPAAEATADMNAGLSSGLPEVGQTPAPAPHSQGQHPSLGAVGGGTGTQGLPLLDELEGMFYSFDPMTRGTRRTPICNSTRSKESRFSPTSRFFSGISLERV